jgi:hypothetical protein
MHSAGRVIALVMTIGLCLAPNGVLAQSIDGAPTPGVTETDTRWESKRLHLGLAGAFVTLQVLDLKTTFDAVKRPGVGEGNPIVASMLDRPAVFVAAKAVSTASAVYLTRKMAKTHPKTAAILMISLNAVLSAVVVSNMSHGAVR